MTKASHSCRVIRGIPVSRTALEIPKWNGKRWLIHSLVTIKEGHLARSMVFNSIDKRHLRTAWLIFAVIHKFRPERNSNAWPLRYRCGTLPTAPVKYMVFHIFICTLEQLLPIIYKWCTHILCQLNSVRSYIVKRWSQKKFSAFDELVQFCLSLLRNPENNGLFSIPFSTGLVTSFTAK